MSSSVLPGKVHLPASDYTDDVTSESFHLERPPRDVGTLEEMGSGGISTGLNCLLIYYFGQNRAEVWGL